MVHDKSLIVNTFNFQCIDTNRWISYSGFWLKLYSHLDPPNMTPWLVEPQQDPGVNRGHQMISKWLRNKGLEEYGDLLIDHGFDRMELVLEMTDHDLQSIGISKVGHRRLLMMEIDSMRKSAFQQYVSTLVL